MLYGVFGLAVLSKGPVGLVLPTAIIGMFLLIMRLPETEPSTTWSQWVISLVRPFSPLHFAKTVWFMRPLLALTACLGVALPWYLWVAARDFRWIEGFFLEHNLNRAVTAFEGHSGPPIYYLLAICVGFFPWSVFFSPLLIDLTRQLKSNSRTRASLIFCSCWVGVWLTAFSIAQTKLPSYITPLYPGLALLMGCFVARITSRQVEISARWYDLTFGLTAFVGLLMTIGLAVAAGIYLPGDHLVAIVGVVLVVGGGLAWWWKTTSDLPKAFGAFALMATLFVVGLFGLVAQRVSDHQAIGRLLAKIDQAVPEATLCSFGVSEASWVYYARQPVKFVPQAAEDLEREFSQGGNTIVLTTPEKLAELPESVRGQLVEVAREPYFLKDYPLIALRPSTELVETATRKVADRR